MEIRGAIDVPLDIAAGLGKRGLEAVVGVAAVTATTCMILFLRAIFLRVRLLLLLVVIVPIYGVLDEIARLTEEVVEGHRRRYWRGRNHRVGLTMSVT